MNRPEENDPLDALLREQNPYVEDNGFSARVVAALPRRAQFRMRRMLLLAATALGAALAVWWLPWKNLPAFNWSAFLSLKSQVWLPWLLVLSVMGSLVWAAIAAAQAEN